MVDSLAEGGVRRYGRLDARPASVNPLFGTYRGQLRSADGRAFELDGVHGVCESFKARL